METYIKYLEDLNQDIPEIISLMVQYRKGEIQLDPKRYAILRDQFKDFQAFVENPEKVLTGLDGVILTEHNETVEQVKGGKKLGGNSKVKVKTESGEKKASVTALFSVSAK